MESTNIYVIVVIYNKNYEDSITLNCLKGVDGIKVIVCDNSTKNFNNELIEKQFGYSYINMNGNRGLSKAYNKALENIDNIDGVVCLFDDDTKVEKKYFNVLREAINDKNAQVFVPIVYDEVGLMSPCIMKGNYLHRAKSIESLNENQMSAINSGMAIRLKVFENYRYDENIFLDYIDHAFIRDMLKLGNNIKIIDTILNQTFSANVRNKHAEEKRFKILKKDLKYFYNGNISNRFYYYYVIVKRKVKLWVKYRDFKVLNW